MTSQWELEYQKIEEAIREGFNHPRSNKRPQLPKGYDWNTQIKKYCPMWWYPKTKIITSMRHYVEREETAAAVLKSRLEEIANEKNPKKRFGILKSGLDRIVPGTSRQELGGPIVSRPTVEKWLHETKSTPSSGLSGLKLKNASNASQNSSDEMLADNRRDAVFCHRGFYDQAMKIVENSYAAIENGLEQGLRLHELDVRLGPGSGPNKTFLAHDEVAGRITPLDRRWSTISLSQVWQTSLVAKSFDFIKNQFGTAFSNTNENVPDLEKLLDRYSNDNSPKTGCTFQIDLRGNDFPRAIAWFRYRKTAHAKLMLKGYNINFPDCASLKQAVKRIAFEEYRATFEWKDLAEFAVPIIMVFYSWPILDLAMKKKKKSRFQLSYEELLEVAQAHVFSFVEIGGYAGTPLLIPEIVHSGLGLGYDERRDIARNPLNGNLITDLSVIVDSRLDRAMIEVSIRLKEKYPTLMFSGCTRLCEVRTTDGQELIAWMTDGELRAKPDPGSDKGISARCRELHGGTYPRSDIVVADDPFAEIAARTWIDEYAKLDRRELLHMDYDTWLKKAGMDVRDAVWGLQGPFLANTVSLTMDSDLRICMPN